MQTTLETKQPSVWANRNFLILFFSGLLINVGSSIYELVLPLMLYELTQSSTVMGGMRAVELLPNLFLAMFIGVYVDRVNRKKFMLWAIFLQAVLLVGLYALVRNGQTHQMIFYTIGFLLMTLSYSQFNARFGVVKQVIPTEFITSANAKFSAVSTFVMVMGPALTGFILMMSNLYDGLLITAAMMTLGLLLTLNLQMEHHPRPQTKATVLQELKAGFAELKKNRPLWLLTWLVAATNGTYGMFSAMLVFFAKDTLRLDNTTLGLALSCAGLGGFLGSFLVQKVRKKISTGKLMAMIVLINGLSFLVMYLLPNLYVMGVSLFVTGVASTIFNVCIWSYRQESTPSHLMGRISGITGSLFKLAAPFTIFGAGWLSAVLGVSYVFLGAGLINLLLFFLCRKSKVLWSLK